MGFGIDLYQSGFGFQGSTGVFKFGRHHAARRTPRGPKIYHHRDIAFGDLCSEPCDVKWGRMLIEQGAMAFAARQFGAAIEFVFGDTVRTVAVWADDMMGHIRVFIVS